MAGFSVATATVGIGPTDPANSAEDDADAERQIWLGAATTPARPGRRCRRTERPIGARTRERGGLSWVTACSQQSSNSVLRCPTDRPRRGWKPKARASTRPTAVHTPKGQQWLKTNPAQGGDRWDTGRIEAFSDGVFAIAITLLILEVSVPESDFDDLWQGIADQWPSYLAYATSFITIGGIWMIHHGIFRRLRIREPLGHANQPAAAHGRLVPALPDEAPGRGDPRDGRRARRRHLLWRDAARDLTPAQRLCGE